MAAAAHLALAKRLQGLNLYLVGMMGAGKSAVAAPLAAALGYRFVDADAVLEASAGRGIAEIFASDGEEAFRELETAVLAQIAGWHSLVVATGGGVVTRPAELEPPAPGGGGVARCAGGPAAGAAAAGPHPTPPAGRPGPRRPAQGPAGARRPLYGQADLCVIQGGEPPEAVAQRLLEALPRGACGSPSAAPEQPCCCAIRTAASARPSWAPGGSIRTANHWMARPGSSSSSQAVSSSR